MKLTYAKNFGPAFGKAKPAKLHYTADGKYTVCGRPCYSPSKHDKPWTDVCGRCQKQFVKA